MTTLSIQESDIGRLDGKVAIITGGASGIGLAAARIFSSRGADVHVLDINPIDWSIDSLVLTGKGSPTATAAPTGTTNGEAKVAIPDTSISNEEPPAPCSSPLSTTSTLPTGKIIQHTCDITHWPSLLTAFTTIGPIDIAVANAGVSQESDPFADSYDAGGILQEPAHAVINVNYRAVLNFVKLSLRAFKGLRQGRRGSLVVVSSATAYAPEQSLPVYSATKLALIGLIRSLRPSIHLHNATINGVAPAATITKLLPTDLAAPIMAAGAPVSHAHHVGLAIAYSAVAQQGKMVEGYGRDRPELVQSPGPWNGRVILTLGDRWTEIEGPLALARDEWMGSWNAQMTSFQQELTDMREVKAQET